MIIPYQHYLHYEMVKGWLEKRGMNIVPKDWMSDTGFVVDDIVVGFLMLTNSKQAYIDNIAIDPEADEKKRDDAMGFLFHALLDLAEDEGYKSVSVLTQSVNMKRRIEKAGFVSQGVFSLYFKLLPGGL